MSAHPLGLLANVRQNAAIHIEDVAVDEVGRIRRKEHRRAAQIRRIADKFSPRTSFEDRKGWGTVRIDSLSNVTISTLAQDDQTMPNVVGMGLKDALFLLESRGLRVSFSGRGSVQYQSIAPGTRISRGGAVTITLK